VTLHWLLAWFVVALLLVVPALSVLYTLDQRGHLGEDPTTSRADHEPGASGPDGHRTPLTELPS
jgi:hypothetical protein